MHFFATNTNSPGFEDYTKSLGGRNSDNCEWWMQVWNLIPFLWLQTQGFSSRAADQATSVFGNTPDAIWFNNRCHLLKQRVVTHFEPDGKIVEEVDASIQQYALSDHNAISATLAVKSWPPPNTWQHCSTTNSNTLVLFLLAIRGFNPDKITLETALKEIRAGAKTSCWAWYFLPCPYKDGCTH